VGYLSLAQTICYSQREKKIEKEREKRKYISYYSSRKTAFIYAMLLLKEKVFKKRDKVTYHVSS